MSLLVVFDTETTGFTPQFGCVWSIGAVAIRHGVIVSEWSSNVRPQPQFFSEKHKDVIRNVSGLDEAALTQLLEAPAWDTTLGSLIAWLDSQSEEVSELSFTSYNVRFDRGFLDAEPFWLSECVESQLGRSVQWSPCLMEASKRAMGLSKWPKLTDACRHFGVPLDEAHQALADTRAAAGLALKLGFGIPPETMTLNLEEDEAMA